MAAANLAVGGQLAPEPSEVKIQRQAIAQDINE